MTSLLATKLVRDLGRMKGQAIAVSLVMACGLAMLIMSRSLIASLSVARDDYYRQHHFAEVFVGLERAPLAVAEQLRSIPGVAAVETGISAQVILDIPGLDEPATGLVKSLPEIGEPELNRLYLRAGRPPRSRGEILVGEAFAEANHLKPGDPIAMILSGRREELRIAGIVLSPEYVFESRPGSALPDNRTYGIFWLPYDSLAAAFDLDGAFNSAAFVLAPGTSERPVIADIDRVLVPYAGRGAFGRADHPSHIRLSDEIRVLTILSFGFPLVFLSVAAFMTNAVLQRLLSLQRDQIAILKAFGFADARIVVHYLGFGVAFVVAGFALGTLGGALLGHRLVNMYHLFFRFPELAFHLDWPALGIALAVGLLAATVGVLGTVRAAANLPPAEAMRPEPPADFRPSVFERPRFARHFSHTFRIAVRNLERRPLRVLFTVSGLSLATGLLIVPNCFRDSIQAILEFQWDVVQRQDVSIGLIEADDEAAKHPLRHLPGTMHVEPFRNAAARLHFGPRRRLVLLQGIAPDSLHERVIDAKNRKIPIPSQGLIVSSKLGEVLGAGPGDVVEVEFLEGRRRRVHVPLVAFCEDFAGLVATLDRRYLNRLLGEGDVISGASFRVDRSRWRDFLRALKEQPRISWVVVKESLRENFRKTTAASIGLIQSIYLLFATVVAFGVVYNNARISLAERARELATLRVVGFTQREVGSILVIELVVMALLAVPLGLLLGTGLARGILGAVNTETVRLPTVFTYRNYAFAVGVISVASTLSAMAVLKRLEDLDLVAALKAPE